jgi:hypothetical protein
MGDSLYHHRRRTTNPRRNPGRNPYTRPNPRRLTNPRRNPTPRRKTTLTMLSARPTDCATPREPPLGTATAVSVQPAVAIVNAVKPIAILRMMMSIVLSTPAFQNPNSKVPDGLQPCGAVARREPQSKIAGTRPPSPPQSLAGSRRLRAARSSNALPRRGVRPPRTIPRWRGLPEAYSQPKQLSIMSYGEFQICIVTRSILREGKPVLVDCASYRDATIRSVIALSSEYRRIRAAGTAHLPAAGHLRASDIDGLQARYLAQHSFSRRVRDHISS